MEPSGLELLLWSYRAFVGEIEEERNPTATRKWRRIG